MEPSLYRMSTDVRSATSFLRVEGLTAAPTPRTRLVLHDSRSFSSTSARHRKTSRRCVAPPPLARRLGRAAVATRRRTPPRSRRGARSAKRERLRARPRTRPSRCSSTTPWCTVSTPLATARFDTPGGIAGDATPRRGGRGASPRAKARTRRTGEPACGAKESVFSGRRAVRHHLLCSVVAATCETQLPQSSSGVHDCAFSQKGDVTLSASRPPGPRTAPARVRIARPDILSSSVRD